MVTYYKHNLAIFSFSSNGDIKRRTVIRFEVLKVTAYCWLRVSRVNHAAYAAFLFCTGTTDLWLYCVISQGEGLSTAYHHLVEQMVCL